ncbi:MAG: prephenate dehydratase [Solirubrobacterales bacterium]
MRVAFLGPAGTNTDDALRAASAGADIEAVPMPSVHEAIAAVEDGAAERAFVPFENSIEGAVRSTLDTLAFEAVSVTIAGEHDHPIHHALIAREALALDRIELVISHEQASAQCARFIRERLPRAQTNTARSTAEAVRTVAGAEGSWAAIGAAGAAELYGAVVLREDIGDEPDNVTRFVWIAPRDLRPSGDGLWRTTLIFSELGADHPGALVDALTEFSSREVNLTRLESRPLRRELGRYMFFVDIEGPASEESVAGAIAALRGKAENVRVLGSYPVNAGGVP